MSDSIISVRGLGKQFLLPKVKRETVREHVFSFFRKNEMEEFKALDDVSFEVAEGECFGVVGKNGSGKSTLLKILAGIYKPDVGSVIVKGRMSPFLELGIGFNLELSARENVFLNAMLLGMSKTQVEDRFDRIFSFAGLERFVDVQVKHFSSGMYSRLAFSVAIQIDAEVYLMDEVLAVGDGEFKEKCFAVFRGFQRSGKTVVLVTHDLGSVRDFCSRALYLKDGVVAAKGDVESVLEAYGSLEV